MFDATHFPLYIEEVYIKRNVYIKYYIHFPFNSETSSLTEMISAQETAGATGAIYVWGWATEKYV